MGDLKLTEVKLKHKGSFYERLCKEPGLCRYCWPREYPELEGCEGHNIDGECQYKKEPYQWGKRVIKHGWRYPAISTLERCPILAEGKTKKDIPRMFLWKKCK